MMDTCRTQDPLLGEEPYVHDVRMPSFTGKKGVLLDHMVAAESLNPGIHIIFDVPPNRAISTP
jgi:hypothetical protein